MNKDIERYRKIYWWKRIEKMLFPLNTLKNAKELKSWLFNYKNYVQSFQVPKHKYKPLENGIIHENFSLEWAITNENKFSIAFRFERGLFKITDSTLKSLRYEKIPAEICENISKAKGEIFKGSNEFIERIWELIEVDIYDEEIKNYSNGIPITYDYDNKFISEIDDFDNIFELTDFKSVQKKEIKSNPTRDEIQEILQSFIVHPDLHIHFESLSHEIRANFASKNIFYLLYQIAFQLIDTENRFENSPSKKEELNRLVDIIESSLKSEKTISSGELFKFKK